MVTQSDSNIKNKNKSYVGLLYIADTEHNRYVDMYTNLVSPSVIHQKIYILT